MRWRSNVFSFTVSIHPTSYCKGELFSAFFSIKNSNVKKQFCFGIRSWINRYYSKPRISIIGPWCQIYFKYVSTLMMNCFSLQKYECCHTVLSHAYFREITVFEPPLNGILQILFGLHERTTLMMVQKCI